MPSELEQAITGAQTASPSPTPDNSNAGGNGGDNNAVNQRVDNQPSVNRQTKDAAYSDALRSALGPIREGKQSAGTDDDPDGDNGAGKGAGTGAGGADNEKNKGADGKPAGDDQKPPTDEEIEAAVSKSNLPKHGKENFKKLREAKAAAEKLAGERAEKIAEYEARLKNAGPIPDDVRAELERTTATSKELASKLREYEIQADPEFQRKYVAPYESNNKAIVQILKDNGFGTQLDASGKVVDVPNAFNQLLEKGLTLTNLQQTIGALEKAGRMDDAEAIRELVRSNIRLSHESDAEVNNWKQTFTARTAEQKQRQQTEAQEAARLTNEAMRSTWDSDTKELADLFPFFKEPPKPLSTDAPAVAQAKQAAYDTFKQGMDEAQKQLIALNEELNLPDGKKRAAASGRILALAQLGIAAKGVIKSQYPKSQAAMQKELTDLRAQLASLNKTGDLSRAHVADMGNGNGSAGAAPKLTGKAGNDASAGLRSFFKGAGVDTNT